MPLYIKNDKVISSNDITSTGVFRSKINRDGLVIYLDAGDINSYSGSGTSWFDLSGNSNNFVLYGSPTYTTNTKFTYTTSQSAYCSNLVPTDYTTFELTFKKISDTASEDIIFNKENTWEMKTDGNSLQWALNTTGVGWFWYTVQGISVGVNYVVTLTYDGNCVRTYVNGVLVQTYTGYTGVLANQSSAYPKINARGTVQTDLSGAGNIDVYDFKVYNRALNPYEVAENFQAIRSRLGI